MKQPLEEYLAGVPEELRESALTLCNLARFVPKESYHFYRQILQETYQRYASHVLTGAPIDRYKVRVETPPFIDRNQVEGFVKVLANMIVKTAKYTSINTKSRKDYIMQLLPNLEKRIDRTV